jgi:CheY-like chemotaxis protein
MLSPTPRGTTCGNEVERGKPKDARGQRLPRRIAVNPPFGVPHPAPNKADSESGRGSEVLWKDNPMALILVVEDHPMNRKLVRDILQFQFEVEEAVSAEAALQILKARRKPDLILTDIQLPGMDGVTLMRRLKADPATAHVPVIALSAHALPRDIQEAREAGCVDYITKPITDDPFTFLERIARGLRAPEARAIVVY